MQIAFITGSRSEWRLVEPMLREASKRPEIDAQLFVAGSHLSPRHGHTVDQIRAAGWTPAACVESLEETDSHAAIARATARTITGMTDALLGMDTLPGAQSNSEPPPAPRPVSRPEPLSAPRPSPRAASQQPAPPISPNAPFSPFHPLTLSRAAATAANLVPVRSQSAQPAAPAWVVVTGDRYETFAAAVAATMLGIPLAHVAGGETDISTNYDCNLRNAITKLAHVHFVAHELAQTRVLALGEEPWRIRIAGLSSLDSINEQCAALEDLQKTANIPAKTPFLLISFFPVTAAADEAAQHLDTLLAALSQLQGVHKLIVLSNADAGGDDLDSKIRDWSARRSDVTCAAALTPEIYLAAMRHCACYVGNSSSGVIEAPAFGTPAIIVGRRQEGRPRAANVRDVASPTPDSLAAAIRAQMTHGPYRGVVSPFGDGHASRRICDALLELHSHPDLLLKRLIVPTAENATEFGHCSAFRAPINADEAIGVDFPLEPEVFDAGFIDFPDHQTDFVAAHGREADILALETLGSQTCASNDHESERFEPRCAR